MTATPSLVTQEQKDLYHREGYMILERVIPDDMLQMLREECAYAIGYADATIDIQGAHPGGITHRDRRYFIANQYRLSHRLHRFLYSNLMAQVAAAALGADAYLFHEQWVVKGPEQGMSFAWHQDSGYITAGDSAATARPYVTCWCTLDEVTEENGTVYILPHSRAGTQDTVFQHTQQNGSNDRVGYTGDDPGDPVVVPAGSIVAFSSFLLHRSGANTTPNMRRVYLPQYSAAPIKGADGSLWAQAVPFLKNGQTVYDHDQDTAEKYGGHPAPPTPEVSHTQPT